MPSRLTEEVESIIDAGIIDKNSTVYNLFESTNNEISALRKEKIFIDDEFPQFVFDNEILKDFAKELRRNYLSHKLNSKYYENFRPELFEFLERIAPKYTIEKGQELTKSVKRLAIEKQCEVEDMYENFMNRIKTLCQAD